MIVNPQVLDLACKGFETVVTDAMMNAPAYAMDVAMTVPSASRDETYGWLGAFPSMREWVGPRHIQNLVANGFVIQNRKFESTVEITRDDISDDKLGLFKPMFAEMGQAAVRHPDGLIFGLIASGFTTNRLMTASSSSGPVTR
jgi:phage major head subunit gpT-like protein